MSGSISKGFFNAHLQKHLYKAEFSEEHFPIHSLRIV